MIDANDANQAAIPEPTTGVYYHGRPGWMTDDLLVALQSEAAVQRPDARLIKRQFHVAAGPCGSGLARSPEMLGLIARHAVPAIADGPANYLYYERPGDGIDPHVDTHEFDLNTLVLLAHSWQSEQASRLVLFPHGPERRLEFPLAPGELVLFRATGVIHARSGVAEGETVCNLGIGYQPQVRLPQASFWRPEGRAAK
jgi:hypothetical protein